MVAWTAKNFGELLGIIRFRILNTLENTTKKKPIQSKSKVRAEHNTTDRAETHSLFKQWGRQESGRLDTKASMLASCVNAPTKDDFVNGNSAK